MKNRKSILDPHAEKLSEWELEKLTLAQMQAKLLELGCKISLGRLSEFLSRARSAQLQRTLLGQIASGARAVKEVEEQFAKNPAPGLETLIKLYRVLILKLSTQGNADPSLIDLATGMTKQAMDFEKLGLKRAELELTREKFELLKAQADKADQTERTLANADLTPAQRAMRIAEIYGRN